VHKLLRYSLLRHPKSSWHGACKGAGGDEYPSETMNPSDAKVNLELVGETNFDAKVLHSKNAVLVAFWVPWSKPCGVIEPVLLDVAQTCAGKIEFVTVNADDEPNLSLQFGVQHIPTLIYFQAGKIRGRLVGTASAKAILKLLFPEGETGSGSESLTEGGML
jgi:thioredoxin 1